MSSVGCYDTLPGDPRFCINTVGLSQTAALRRCCRSTCRATAEERVAALNEELAQREQQLSEQLRAAQAQSIAQLSDAEVRAERMHGAPVRV